MLSIILFNGLPEVSFGVTIIRNLYLCRGDAEPIRWQRQKKREDSNHEDMERVSVCVLIFQDISINLC